MKKEEVTELIEEVSQCTAETLIIRLKKEKLLKSGKTPFQKVEALLYSYNKFKSIIESKEDEIERIRADGLQKKSNSITTYNPNSYIEPTSEMEQIEKAIEKLQSDIAITQFAICKLNLALEQIANDKYYPIIKLRYIQGKTIDEIAEELGKDVATIYRNKNRLIDALKINLFTDSTILEMMN